MSLRQRAYGYARPRFQRARIELLLGLVSPAPKARVLDLGGADGTFARFLRDRMPLDITVADIGDHRSAVESNGFRFVRLDDTDRLPFDDAEFDLVFCNSVIEHVTSRDDLPERRWQAVSEQRQITFAKEIRRVASAFFVQTPHRDFPIETHSLLPFANWLPHRATRRLLTVTSRVWISPARADWRLLDEGDMRTLFPDATVHVERFAGLPKSVIAYRQ